MKFACDRCKTRYSISDERVRGKILKIRCKSCANVITVREGMEVPQAEEHERSHRPTTMAPQTTIGSGGRAPAAAPAPTLGAAFASAMAAPQAPTKLEDEWYVSRDGDQQGPFALPNAQAWVSQQPYDAELHCWCEGFDDWLPVDRIAHFRGLRTRPEPPPLPAAPPSSVRSPSGSLPSLVDSRSAPAIPSSGAAPRSTQIGAAPGPLAGGRAGNAAAVAPRPIDEKPLFAASMAALQPDLAPARPDPAVNGFFPSGGSGAQGQALGPRNGAHAAPRSANPLATPTPSTVFDTGDLGNQGFAADASASGLRVASGLSAFPTSLDEDLEFGEVSRVVRIADIGKGQGARSAPRSLNDAAPAAFAPGMATAGPALAPAPSSAMAALEAAARVDVPLAMPAKQRRNHAILLGLVAVGLIGAGLIALLLVQGSETQDPSLVAISGRDVTDLTIRPDDPRRSGSGATTGADDGPSTPTTPTRPTTVKRPTIPSSGTGSGSTVTGGKVETSPSTGALTALGGDEVEAMSQRNSSGLQRCYEQALKKDIFLEVKSIKVTISIDPSGVVKGVEMSSHADHVLGQCMMARIRGWRFRPNSKGLDAKFTVAFGRT